MMVVPQEKEYHKQILALVVEYHLKTEEYKLHSREHLPNYSREKLKDPKVLEFQLNSMEPELGPQPFSDNYSWNAQPQAQKRPP